MLQWIQDLKQFLAWIYRDLRQVEKSSVGLGMRRAFTVDGSVCYVSYERSDEGMSYGIAGG